MGASLSPRLRLLIRNREIQVLWNHFDDAYVNRLLDSALAEKNFLFQFADLSPSNIKLLLQGIGVKLAYGDSTSRIGEH